MYKLNLSKNKKYYFLYLILLIKLFLGIKILFWGYPIFASADEPLFVKTGLKVLYRAFNNFDFNPYFYDWPNFIIYLNAFVSSLYIFYNIILGINPEEIPHINFVILIRTAALLTSILHTYIIFRITKKIYNANIALLIG